jgi:hypothetical protein
MALPLFTELEGHVPIARHDHVAVLYRGRSAAFRLISFLAEGLERGDLCHYLGPRDLHAEVFERLRARKIDVPQYLGSGTLRLDEGLGDLAELRKRTEQVFADAERGGVPGIRWLEEGLWPGPVGFPMEKFFEFHALLNFQVKHYPSVALCQYGLDELEPHHLFGALAVHRHLLVEDTLVRDNPFYIPAEKFIPLRPEERERDLVALFREVGFDVEKFLAAIAGYGRLQDEP